MWKKLLTLCLASSFAFGEVENDPYKMTVFGGEPSGVVDGCVNPINGDYFVSEAVCSPHVQGEGGAAVCRWHD